MKTKYHSTLATAVAKGGDQKQNNTIHRKWFAFALGGFLFISLCALPPSPAQAACQQYDVSGQWAIQQGSYFITVALSQNGKTISGTAQQNWTADHQVRVLQGQVTGTIAGREFDVQINWKGGGAGVYRGSVAISGELFGTTYDVKDLRSTSRWESTVKFKCADAALIPPRKVIKPTFPKTATPEQTRGVVPGPDDYKKLQDEVNKAAATPTPSAAATPAAPRITANPASGTGGSTTLTWDGGPKHPYAEVWVAVDGGDPTFMVEQGKGSRRVTVEPGKTYRYILTDSGKDLSTVTVRGK